MPYDTNGNYTLPTIYYAISGTVINPSQHNSPFEDVQAALNRALLRDGSAALTGPMNAGNQKITNLKEGTNGTDAATISQISSFATEEWVNGAFVKNNNSNSGGIVSADMDSSGVPSFQSGEGNWYPVQLKGDYATNADLNAEAQRASTIESNLQSSKANLGGGNRLTGDQTVSGSVLVGMGMGWGGGTSSGQTRWSNGHLAFGSPDNTPNTYTGYFQITDTLGSPGSDYSGIDMFGFDYSGARYEWHFPWNGNIITQKGYVAFQTDLNNYVSNSQYNGDFGTSDVRVTNLPYGQRLVSFNVLITTNGQYVPFPEAFSDIPISVVPGDCGNDAGKTDAWPVAAPMQKWTAAGCNIYIGSGAVPRRVSIIAKGSR